MSRKILQQALEALVQADRTVTSEDSPPQYVDIVAAIRAHLATPEQDEPVAYVQYSVGRQPRFIPVIAGRVKLEGYIEDWNPLYDHPALIPPGMVLVGWLDGRGRFFYADDPMYKDRHEGMREVFAAAKKGE